MKHNKDADHKDERIYCATDQFHELQFLGAHNKPHGVRGLGNHSHICFYYKLGNDTCAIRSITCACTTCTYMLDQPWAPVMTSQQQPHYQPIKYCT